MQLNKDYSPADADLEGFASNVSGASFTLTANDAGDGFAHKVTIRNDSATDHSAKTVTLVGTDIYGNSLTETISAPAASATVTSTEYFLTLESATPSATIGADTFDIGWNAEMLMKPVAANWRGGEAGLQITVTGTINYDLEQTNYDIQNSDTDPVWFTDDVTHVGATDNLVVLFTVSPRFFRLKINSGSSITINLALVQSDV